MTPLTCILFDFGNVIAFFDHMIACRKLAALTSEGLGAEEVYRRLFVSDLEDRYECGRMSTAEFIEALKRGLGLEASEDAIAAAWTDIFTENTAVTSLIPRLKSAGLRLVLASNTNELHLGRINEQFADVMKHFDRLTVSFRVGARKPDPRFFDALVEAAGCPPDRCLYLDDRADFIEIGRGLGMRGIVYSPEVDLESALREMNLDL